jgi:drug/metabolite transporter (DMT)-like permease
VNPLVAVALGYFLGGEEIGRRTLLGMLLILTSVVAITTMRKPEAKAKLNENESAAKLSPAEAD